MKKENEQYKIALTIDVEDWYHTPAVTGSDFSFYKDVPEFMKNWNEKYDYLTKPTIKVLNLLEEFDLKATFFIVADVVDYYPGLVELVAEKGHEISCHGLHHALNIDSKYKKPVVSVDEFENRTGLAREKLQNVTGQAIIGYRAPSAYLGEWMYESLIKLGFKYDSSVNANSFFSKVDFDTKYIKPNPYFFEFSNEKILEIPWPYFKLFSLRFPAAGGPLLRFFPSDYIFKGIDYSLQTGDSVFYFHPIDISNINLPSLASKNSKRPFYFITSGEQTSKKLNKLICLFYKRWTTAKNILDQAYNRQISEFST